MTATCMHNTQDVFALYLKYFYTGSIVRVAKMDDRLRPGRQAGRIIFNQNSGGYRGSTGQIGHQFNFQQGTNGAHYYTA